MFHSSQRLGASPTAFALALCVALGSSACATTKPSRYRFAELVPPVDLQAPDYKPLRKRYRPFFRRIERGPGFAANADLRPLALDLERQPVSGANYKSLNTIALAYLYLHEHRERWPGGSRGFYDSTFLASLLAIPWSAYKQRESPELRESILAFYEDLERREGTLAGRNRVLLASNVARLERREEDPERQQRLRELAARLRQGIEPAGTS